MKTDAARLARCIVAEPLTSQAFAEFGEVVEHAGNERRRHLALPYAHSAPAARTAIWVSRVESAIPQPCPVLLLERHPYSSQTFIPLDNTPYLVVVAPDDAQGEPDLERLRAFVASGSQGVCYRTGVWHQGLSTLRAPAQFAVTMTLTGAGDDDVFWKMPDSVSIAIDCTLPASRPRSDPAT
ncbi:ureidoglycolate lyase [Achromobacter sp. Marseille-Q0513]|uniref:ureidoglycolate lyase n=1 Tax=Achromobacter sp. Marseille-Q0513 TaxID=2829161 RepID=UPI001BA2A18C|nr:ureidoglycolate lyase [Achromobacter sp. Marseille-Q0513]MBR8652818.1 ureidoglycolate lyase [Achromobacter sp. Marseille-Q0513]